MVRKRGSPPVPILTARSSTPPFWNLVEIKGNETIVYKCVYIANVYRKEIYPDKGVTVVSHADHSTRTRHADSRHVDWTADTLNHSFALGFETALKACLRSSFRSSTSSTPMLRRMSLGSDPESDRILCSMSDSTPPKLVAGCSRLHETMWGSLRNGTYDEIFRCLWKMHGVLWGYQLPEVKCKISVSSEAVD